MPAHDGAAVNRSGCVFRLRLIGRAWEPAPTTIGISKFWTFYPIFSVFPFVFVLFVVAFFRFFRFFSFSSLLQNSIFPKFLPQNRGLELLKSVVF